MKQVFKVIFITLLCTIGGVALFAGGAYLFGAFNEKIVYAENLYFNQTEVISDDGFSLRIDTSTEGVTKKTVKLEAMYGGERIINIPETVTIGEDFFITPVTENNQNIGGVVELYCKYEEKEAPQGVVAKCRILIDVKVESCSVKLSKKQCKMNGSILVAEKNTNLSEILDVTPSNALNPYILKSSLNISNSQGVFKNFSDKKIFLTLSSNAKFFVDGVEKTNILELPYTYNETYSETADETKSFFTITSKIEIKPNENEKGEIVLKSYILPTYKSQNNVIKDKNQDSVTTINLLEKTTNEQALSSNLNLIVSDYEVEKMTTNASTSMDINYGEEVTIYLNNPNAEKGSLNLGVQLSSNTGPSQIDTFYFQKYVFVEVVGTGEIKSLKDSLCRLNGSTSEDGKLNVYYDGIDDKESTWCFKYKYSDFMAYYNYKNDNSDKNRIELKVWYQNNDEKIGLTSFYFIPKAREIESITTKYDSGEQFIYKSGSPLSLTKSNFNITYANSLKATFENLGYFIKIEDSIVFYPTKSGDYKAKFSFIPTSAGGVDNNSFSGLSSWCNLAESVVTLTQGNNSCTIRFDKSGSCTTDGSNISFEAGKKIDVEINSFKVTTSITQFDTSLFVVKIGQAQHTIKLKQVKFYDLTDNNQNTTPILIANDATIAGEYSFVTLDGIDYIYLNTTSDVILSGIASFNLVAMNIYQEDENVYFLGKSTNVGIYVYEEISSLKIYNYNTEEKSYSALPVTTTQYEERSASGTLFITSAQLDTLSRLVELGQSEGKSRINFVVKQRVPDTLTLTDEQLSAVAEKNKNAITFGDLSPVYDKNDSTKLIGFTIPYTIGEFYTLKIEDKELYSTFDIKVQIEGADNATLIGQFVYEDKQETQSWAISITDKVYKNVAITHGYSSLGTSKENPIVMTASLNLAGDLVWTPTGASSLDKGVLKVAYGYLGSDNKIVSSLTANCTTKIVSLDTQKILNPSPYCYYDNAQGGIVLKNVPYYENGIIFKFQVYVSSDQKSNSNSYYAWSENAFVETLFSDLGENNGVSLYFKLTGLNIEITPNKNKTVDGIKANTYSLFGDSGLFKVAINGNGANNYDLSKVLTCVLTSDMKKSLKLSTDYRTLTIDTNFLKDEECTFTFYVGQNSTDTATINISSENNYTITIASALNINVTKQFTAPSTNVSFATITAKGGNATEGLKSSITLGSGTDFTSVNNSDGTLSFKTITGTKTITVILTLYYENDSSTKKTITYNDITVTSKYFDSKLVVGKLDEKGEYYITAGETYSVNKGISFTDGLRTDFNNISTIFATFENATIDGTSHIASPSKPVGISDFSFSSYDLNEDKDITITFTLTFNDGGQLVVTKNVKLKANLTISFASKGGGNYQSGNSIDLSDKNNYIVTRNGEKVTDFSTSGYTMKSFVYKDKYFYKPTTSSSDCVLCVRSASENLQAQDNVETAITFTYKVMVNGQELYTLDFVLTLTINITTAG